MAQVEGNVKVNVNANQAVRELEKLENKAEELRQELIKINKQKVIDPKKVKLLEKELRNVTKETNKLRQSAANYQTVLKNLSGSSLKNLSKAARQLTYEMNNLDRNTKEWKQKAEQLGKIKAEISSVRKKMQGLNTTTKKSQGLFGKATDQFNKFGAIGIAIIGSLMMAFNAFKQVFQKFTKTLMDFEDSFTDVLTLLSSDQINEFGESLEKGAIQTMTKFGLEINDVNKSLFDTVSAGINAADAIDVLNAAGTLATAGATNLSVATDGLTTIINAHNLETKEAIDVSNAFFSAQKFGKTTVEELAANYGKLAPVLSIVNVSYQEGLSMLAEMTKQGISTAESTTYLKSMFKSLIKPTAEAEKVLRQFNVPVGVTEIQAAGLTNTLEALNNMIEQNPDAIAQAIPSVEGMTAAFALSGESLDDFTNILSSVNADIGDNSSMMDAYSIKSETMSFKIEQQKAKLSALILELKDKFAPVISTALTYISKFTNFIRNLTIEFFKTGSEQKQWVVILKQIWKLIDSLVSGILKPLIYTLKEIFFNTNKNVILSRTFIGILKFLVNVVKAVVLVFGDMIKILVDIAAAFLTYNNNVQEVTDSQQRLKDMNNKIIKTIIDERNEITKLLAIAKNENKSKQERLDAIKKLNAISPEYLNSITLETVNTEETVVAINSYISALESKTKAQIASQYAEQITAEIMEKEIQLYKKQEQLMNELTLAENSYLPNKSFEDMTPVEQQTQSEVRVDAKSAFTTQTKGDILAIQESIAQLEQEKQNYLAMVEDMGIDFSELYTQTDPDTDLGNGGGLTPPVPDYTDVKNNEAELAAYITNIRKELLFDEKQRKIEELRIWNEAEQQKINDWTAAQQEKDIALELLQKQHQRKLTEINNYYSKINYQKITELTDLVRKKELELYGTREQLIQSEIEKIRSSYDEKIALAQEMARKDNSNAILFAQKAEELRDLREEEVKQYRLEKEEEFQKQMQDVKNKYGLQTDDEKMQIELDDLQSLYDQKLISEENFQLAKQNIIDKYNTTELLSAEELEDQKKQLRQSNLQDSMQVIDTLGKFFSTMKEDELREAGDNEEKKKEIMKRYADIEIGVTISKIIASSALAIMQALAQLGPIAGGIAAGLITLTAGAQLTAAVNERAKIQGMESGGVAVVREQDGKHFTATPTSNRGVISKPSILVAENGPEYVVPNEGMENPEIMNFLMMIENSRVAGTLKQFSFPTKIKGYEDGGLTNSITTESPAKSETDALSKKADILIASFLEFKKEITAWQKALYVDYFSFKEADEEISKLETKATIK